MGDVSVGKTCLIARYLEGVFPYNIAPYDHIHETYYKDVIVEDKLLQIHQVNLI